MLTGKCKEEFEKWLENQNFEECNISDEYSFQPNYIGDFERLPFSMQYGVYVDFFDSVDIKIIIGTGFSGYLFNYRLSITGMQDEFDNEIEARTEARQKAIEKANEIYNQN